MKVAGIDLYVDHPIMALGATEWIPASLALYDDAAAGCDTHVVVRVQAQMLVKVRLFSEREEGEQPDPAFSTVFDGTLLLSNGRMVVGDVMGDSRFVKYLGKPGTWHVRVAVDDPVGFARAVDIVVRYEQ